MSDSFSLFLLAVFVFTQWRITVLLLGLADRRLSGSRRAAARYGIFLFDFLLSLGYVLSFSPVIRYFEISGSVPIVMGALALIYSVIATAVLLLHWIGKGLKRHFNAEADEGRRRALNTAGSALMISPFALMGYGALIQRTNFHVHELDVPLPGLPPDLHGLRILQLSDIHLSAFLSESELARVIDAASELQPHLAVMTGDLITTFGDPLDACIRQLTRVKAEAGMLGCLGNHEHFARVEQRTTETAARAGIRFLRMKAEPLRFGNAILNVGGVDYQSLHRKAEYLRGAERLVAPNAFNLLLSHNPDVFPVAAHQGWNLMLAGHTHGGQINIEILDQSISPALFMTPYVYGLYRAGSSTAYVTRGIGTIGVPIRIGAPPEIVLLRLRKA
ncbi:MAG TPA: metallophosphoesterase [Bryobacteraceae bacterium]|nr:metallophosphoesterase [Bryobacteraceae bacterium]